MGGDQCRQSILLSAEALEQGGLFFRAETVPDGDHLFGSADQHAGLGFVESVSHAGFRNLGSGGCKAE